MPSEHAPGVIEAIESDQSLPKNRKTEFTTGIKTFCRCVGRDPSEIDANPVALRALSALRQTEADRDQHQAISLIPSRASRRRWSTLGSPSTGAVKCRSTPAWEALLEQVSTRPSGSSCASSPAGAPPKALNPRRSPRSVFDSYYRFLEEQSIQHNLRERWHRARRAWNDAVAIVGSGYLHIENPFDRWEKLPSLADFPAGFVSATARLPRGADQAHDFRLAGGLSDRCDESMGAG